MAVSPPGTPASDGPSKIPDAGTAESADDYEMVDYSNNKLTIAVGVAIWLLVVAANVYVLIDLARGGSG
jgi:metal iron transporter